MHRAITRLRRLVATILAEPKMLTVRQTSLRTPLVPAGLPALLKQPGVTFRAAQASNPLAPWSLRTRRLAGRSWCSCCRLLSASILFGWAAISAGCGAYVTPSPPTLQPEPPAVETAGLPVPGTPRATATFAPTATPRPTEVRPTATSSPTAAPVPAVTATVPPTPRPGDMPTPPVRLTAIRSITEAQLGQVLTLEADVVDTASFSAGFKYTLHDGTGRIPLLMWHSVYDDCWDIAGIHRGARIRVTGEVTQYEGQLEIQPRFGGDVKAVHAAVEPVPGREIGSISGADEGDLVMIEGRVVRTEGMPSAVKVFVADETGEILVFIWRNILNRIIDNTGLGTPGSRVRTVGRLQVYRSNLEVVPMVPQDVTVLEIP